MIDFFLYLLQNTYNSLAWSKGHLQDICSGIDRINDEVFFGTYFRKKAKYVQLCGLVERTRNI